MPVKARRHRVMYSARAGIVSRTVGPLPFELIDWFAAISSGLPTGSRIKLTKPTQSHGSPQPWWLLCPVTGDLTRWQLALAERDRHLLQVPIPDHTEDGHLVRLERERDDPHDVVRPLHGNTVDRDDQVAARDEVLDPQHVELVVAP